MLTASPPAAAIPITVAPLLCAASRKEEKSVVWGNGYAARPSTLPPEDFTNADASRSSCWPKT